MKYNRDVDYYITNRALELIGAGYSEAQAAKLISEEIGMEVSRNVVHGRVYRRHTRDFVHNLSQHLVMPYFDKYKVYYEGEMPPKAKVSYELNTGLLKILVLNDLHTPWQHKDAIMLALLENRSADVVVASEVSDLYSLTSFAKYQHSSFELEVEEIIRLFEFFDSNFPITYIVSCGHDRRLPRYILSRIRSDLLFLVETDLMGVLARPFPGVITIPKNYYQINDAVFTHLDVNSSIPMRSAIRSHEWIQSWGEHIDVAPYRLLVQAHSHGSGIVNLPGVQLVESGCLQTIPQWVLNKLPRRAWVHGWVVVYQNDGVTDLNATQLRVYREN